MSPKLARYLEMADSPELLPPGMLGAFAACFNWNELCDALLYLIGSGDRTRSPVQRRLLLMAKSSPNADALALIVPKLFACVDEHPRLLRRVGYIISSMFEMLPPETQDEAVSYWKRSSALDSQNRWLKIADRIERFFDPDEIYQVWLRSGDYTALQLVASKAPPRFLQAVLDTIIEHCGDGRILSRAARPCPGPWCSSGG
jgi:hypothetical protein